MFSVESNHSSKRFFVFKKITVIIVLPIVIWLFFGLTGWPFHLDVIFLFMPIVVSLLILWKAGKSDAAKFIVVFLIVDVIRWLSVFISLWFPDPIPEPYFYWQLYIVVFFIFLFPFMY